MRNVVGKLGILSIVFLMVGVRHSAAQNVQDCDGALVLATYNEADSRMVEWEMAEKVDESTYDKIKNSGGIGVEIFGVPIGANWDEFEQNVQFYSSSHNESYSSNEFHNVAWTKLSPGAQDAYRACLNTLAQSGQGLHLFPDHATSSDISIRIVYSPVGSSPNPLHVTWSGAAAAKNNQLPHTILAGERTIVIRRPANESTLAINGDGRTDSVVVTPIPPIIEGPKLASSCNLSQTLDPLPQLGKNGTTAWACPQMQAGAYRVVFSVTPNSTPVVPLRVSYQLTLLAVSPTTTTRTQLDPTSSNPMDINIAAGLSNSIESVGQIVHLPAGAPSFELAITGIVNHCCFPNSGGQDGLVIIPRNVTIALEKQ